MPTNDAQRLRAVFDEAVELSSKEREAYLARVCGEDTNLRAEVQTLLEQHDAEPGFLEPPSSHKLLAAVGGLDFAGDSSAHFPKVKGFRVLAVLGKGGMGVVYEAVQEHPKRRVALKVIHQTQLFEREQDSLALLKHPAIAAIYDAGRTEQGQPFFAMELVDGTPLNVHARQQALPIRSLLTLFGRVCEAVSHAHTRGVIHRDLKPGNILVDSCGQPKVLDFGLARITDTDITTVTAFTEVGKIQGTLPYMSPEQARGDPREIDLRADIYSLGVILYELLTGRLPYDVGTTVLHEAVRVICEQEPRRPSGVQKVLRGDMETIVLRALEKDPSRRYQSVAALADDINRYLGNQPILARPPTFGYQLHKLVSRHKVPFVAAAALFVGVTIIAVWMTTLYARAERHRVAERGQRQLAESNLTRAEAAEREALLAATTATRVSAFLQEMLISVTPENARGRDVTVLREILERSSDRICSELAEEPRVAAEIHHVIGWVYQSLGVFDKAERHLRDALDLKRAVLGDSDAAVAVEKNTLGFLYHKMGRLREAEELMRDALEAQRNSAETKPDQMARTLNKYAMLLVDLARYGEAEPMLREALAISRAGPGADDSVLADMTNDLGIFLYHKGAYAESEVLLNEALDMRRRSPGSDHPAVAQALNNLGSVRLAQGDFAGAATLLEDALRIRRRVFGDAHPEVANSLNNLASTLQHLQRYEEAETQLREALSIMRTAEGDRHPDVATALSNLGVLLNVRGKHADAESVLWEAIEVEQATLGAEHPKRAFALLALADAVLRQNRPAEAEQSARLALELRERALPESHWLIPYTRAFLGECLAAQGRYAEAEPLIVESAERLAAQRGPGDKHVRQTRRRAVRLYQAWGKPDEAARYVEGEPPALPSLESQGP